MAAIHALSAEKNNNMKTHDIHAELVYKLAADKNVSQICRSRSFLIIIHVLDRCESEKIRPNQQHYEPPYSSGI